MDDKLRPPTALQGELPLAWIIFTHGGAKSKQVQTFSTSPFNNKSYLRSVPEMRGKVIEAAHLGWLWLRDRRVEDRDNYSFTLWNPFTLKSIQLPTLNFHDEGPGRMQFALTSSPDDDNCFAFLLFRGRAFCCQIDKKRRQQDGSGSGSGSGSASWVSERLEIEGVASAIFSPVTLNGVLYGHSFTHDLVNDSVKRFLVRVCIEVIDDDDGGSNSFTIKLLPTLISMPPQSSLMLGSCRHFMVESCGNIYVVIVWTHQCDSMHGVRIFELELQNGTWAEVKCLGDRAFLLTYHASTWWPASASASSSTGNVVKGNCVYFLWYEFVKDAVACYSLSDCSSTFLPCPKLFNPRTSWPVWVTPQHNSAVGYRTEKSTESCKTEAVSTSTDWKSLVEPEKKQENNNMMCKLPLHIIELISKHMHLFDYWNFRSTCKTIQSATSIARWKNNSVFPLLMVFEDEGGLCRIMDPCRDDSRFCNLQAQNLFDIRFSKNGWMLIYENNDGKFIRVCNPFTRENWYLPSLTYRSATIIGFSSYPSCSSCLTVAISGSSVEIIINYLRFGDKEWNSCHFGNNNNNQGDPFYPSFASPMYYAGGFYVLDENTGNLGVFELGDGDGDGDGDGGPQWTVYNRPLIPAGVFHSSYLVECRGDLISVFIGDKGSWVQVFRFNNMNKKWIRVKDIGNHILFISHTSCFCEVSKLKKIRNRIYLPWLKGNNIVYYSLDTGKYQVDGAATATATQQEFKDFFYIKQPFRCCWL